MRPIALLPKRSRHRWWPLVVVSVLIGLSGPTAATAQTGSERIKLGAETAFDGWYDEGEWVEARAFLENTGPDTVVELRMQPGRTKFVVPVELPRGAVKQVPIAFLTGPGQSQTVNLALYQGDARLSYRRLNLRPTRDERIVVVVSDGDATLNGVEGLVGDTGDVLVSQRPRQLPENSLAMASVDSMVLAGADLSRLNEAQRDALYQWVAFGGQLVITGGAEVGAVMAELPERMRPAEVSGVRETNDFGALGWMDADPIEGSATVAALAPVAGAREIRTAENGTLPLVVSRPLGDGEVIVLAFDPSAAPFDRWRGLPALWGALGGIYSARTAEPLRRPDPTLISQAVTLRPEFNLPSISLTMALIFGYIVLVGPVNYAVLRRLRRLDLAWVTIPLLTVAASTLAYGVGYRLHGGQLRTYELTSVRVVPDAGVAHVTMYFGLFSPGDRAYDVLVPGALVHAASDGGGLDGYGGGGASNAVEAVQGTRAGARDLRVAQWSLGGFAAEAVVPWPDAETGVVRREGDHVTGIVVNPFGRSLRGAQLIIAGDHLWYGQMPEDFLEEVSRPYASAMRHELDFDLLPDDGRDEAEQHARVSLARSTFVARPDGTNNPYGYQYGMREAGVITRFFNEAVLFAFDDAPVLEPEVVGERDERDTYTMYHARVPLEQGQAGTGGTLGGEVQDASRASLDLCGIGGVMLHAEGQPEAWFEFEMPPPVSGGWWVQLEGPKIPDGSGYPGATDLAVDVSAYDWLSEDWRELGRVEDGKAVRLPDAALAPGGESVWVRLAALDGDDAWASVEPWVRDEMFLEITSEGGSPCWVPTLRPDPGGGAGNE